LLDSLPQAFADFIKSMKRNKASTSGAIAMEAYEMITEIMHLDNGFDDLLVKDCQK